MFSKVYEKVKQILKENYLPILIFIVFALIINIELPYYINAPGGIIDLGGRVEIENKYESSGSFNLSYVSELKATIPTLIIAKLNKDWDIVKEADLVYENETYEDSNYRSHLLLDEANNNAIKVSYRYAGKEITIQNEKVYVIYIDEEADTDLKIGDQILKIDGEEITDKNHLFEVMATKNLNDNINITVLRSDKMVTCYGNVRNLNDKKIIGVVLSTKSDIETNPVVKLNFEKSESGPSGGLMLSLAIYNSLTPLDITKGKIIVGTGTIDENGNIGSIGGVEYKIKGAIKAKADIFLVPAGENYEDAKAVVAKNKYKIELVPVSTFEEALDFLKNM